MRLLFRGDVFLLDDVDQIILGQIQAVVVLDKLFALLDLVVHVPFGILHVLLIWLTASHNVNNIKMDYLVLSQLGVHHGKPCSVLKQIL